MESRQMVYMIFVESRQMVYMISFAKQKQIHRCRLKNCMDTKEKGGRWNEMGDWDGHLYNIDVMYKIDN